MRTASKMTSVAAACGAGALGLALIAMGSGVGAAFTDSATANANIATGTFGCQLSSTDLSVVISNNAHTATVDLGTISSSAASSKTAPVTVTNTGAIPLVTSWGETTLGNILDGSGAISAVPAAAGVPLATGATQTVNIGFQWSQLSNSDLNRSGTAQYTVSCNEAPNTQIVRSATLNFGPTGWAGWSCPAGKQIVSATSESETVGGSGDGLLASINPWKAGATAGGFTYPNTQFGYTYPTGEEGAIAQNNNDSDSIVLVLTCTA